MKYKSVILPIAKDDLQRAVKWYKTASPEIGKMLIKRFRETLALLRSHPHACQIRYSQVQTALLEQFPYMIHYYVDTQNKTIVVISILHTSRDPQMWSERLENA